MMWIRFKVDHSHKPVPMQTTDYKVGMVVNLPHAAAEKLVAQGKAEKVDAKDAPRQTHPPRKGAPNAKPEAEGE
jgi:hypothetical protein